MNPLVQGLLLCTLSQTLQPVDTYTYSGGGAVAIDEVVERGTAYSHGTTYVPEAFLLEVRTLTHATNTYQRRQASQERVTSSQ